MWKYCVAVGVSVAVSDSLDESGSVGVVLTTSSTSIEGSSAGALEPLVSCGMTMRWPG